MSLKRKVVRRFQKYVLNPFVRLLIHRGLLTNYVILETTGRKTGRQRETPVGMKVEDDEGWMVSEHGRHSSYVRNIEADSSVRVKVGGTWRSGTAQLLDGDDPVARLHALWGKKGNTPAVMIAGTDLLSIRIDLEPQPA